MFRVKVLQTSMDGFLDILDLKYFLHSKKANISVWVTFNMNNNSYLLTMATGKVKWEMLEGSQETVSALHKQTNKFKQNQRRL